MYHQEKHRTLFNECVMDRTDARRQPGALSHGCQSATESTICHISRSSEGAMSLNFARVLVNADQQKSAFVRTEMVSVPGNEPPCHQLFCELTNRPLA